MDAVTKQSFRSALAHVDRVLRGSSESEAKPVTLRQLMLMLVAAGFFYGAVMGAYSGGLRHPRVLQMLYSGVKVPLLLVATFALSLPSFFVFNTLLGLRQDFGRAIRALGSTQAALTLILASVGPLTALWYISFANYQNAILFNAAMFALATFAAQIVLRKLYRPLIQSNRRHLLMIRAWLIVYAFVGIQMGWVLRPFIGDPAQPTTFFRQHAFTNAYEEVLKLVAHTWK